jgi:hydrogenase maturation protein HypF
MAVSYLQDAYGSDFSGLKLPAMREIDSEKLTVVSEMIAKGINAPMTSSLGRLFDGVAAIMGIRNRVNYEGQAAMELEMMAAEPSDSQYRIGWKTGTVLHIPPAPIIRGVVTDILNQVPVGEIAAKFHRTLIRLFADVCEFVRKDSGLNRVALSGGCFQNATLLAGLIQALTEKKFEVFSQQQVPTNDGGIALGQAVVAAAKCGAKISSI